MTRPYDDLTVLDLTCEFGRYAGRLFADLGATTIRVEPPGGLPDRVLMERAADPELVSAFAFLNASKKSVVVDFATAAGMSSFATLAASAAIVLLERGGPLYDDAARVRALAGPKAVVASISPFGREGPRAGDPATDLTLQAAGGLAWLSGRPDDAPLRLPEGQATMIAGVYAAVVASLALADAEVHGHGHDIDVSVQECIAHSLQNSIQVYDFEDRVSMRGGEGTRDATEDIFACKDGFVFLAAPLQLGVSWSALLGLMRDQGHPAAAYFADARWNDRPWRLTREAKAQFREHVETFLRGMTKEQLTREAIARKIVMGPVSTIKDMFEDPQLVHRRFFIDLAVDGRTIRFPGAPYALSRPVWSAHPAPSLGTWAEAAS